VVPLAPVPEERSGLGGSMHAIPFQASNAILEALGILEQEREQRKADIASLRLQIEAHREKLDDLGYRSAAYCNHTEGLEASITELRKSIAAQQKQQDVQAAALREGLMEIQMHRAALTKIAKEGGANTVATGDASDISTDTPSETPRQAGNEQRSVASEYHARLSRDVGEALTAIDKQREHLLKAVDDERAARRSEVAEMRSEKERITAKQLELHAALSQELADMMRNNERRYADLSRAMEDERVSRLAEISALRLVCIAPVGSKVAETQEDSDLQGFFGNLMDQVTKQIERAANNKSDFGGVLDDVSKRISRVEQTQHATAIEQEHSLNLLQAEVVKISKTMESLEAAGATETMYGGKANSGSLHEGHGSACQIGKLAEVDCAILKT